MSVRLRKMSPRSTGAGLLPAAVVSLSLFILRLPWPPRRGRSKRMRHRRQSPGVRAPEVRPGHGGVCYRGPGGAVQGGRCWRGSLIAGRGVARFDVKAVSGIWRPRRTPARLQHPLMRSPRRGALQSSSELVFGFGRRNGARRRSAGARWRSPEALTGGSSRGLGRPGAVRQPAMTDDGQP
jgi:hypothetical protein